MCCVVFSTVILCALGGRSVASGVSGLVSVHNKLEFAVYVSLDGQIKPLMTFKEQNMEVDVDWDAISAIDWQGDNEKMPGCHYRTG